MALAIVLNAKTHRVSVCNAMETLLVHAAVAPAFLPMAAARLGEAGVELRADERARILVPGAVPATAADWDTEYLDYVLAVKVVTTFEEAIAHIRRHVRPRRGHRPRTSAARGGSPAGRRGGGARGMPPRGWWMLGVRHGRRDGDLDLKLHARARSVCES